ncbi:Mu transposase C-terminal domain-containing protein [Palleronia caenipelagi]|uniref:Integrase catalytic domain-containing protein n=1 Tax=Palleronia caenipelagi TaxID=2489174 RepID=A0A547PN12_9RHOB|nr:Mu transposase C-terminal domain-containing protein [Palleronia caenipelagi]TRD15526.1 hypothetical protein FEV53_15995 [Palleronia caenipelagi]
MTRRIHTTEQDLWIIDGVRYGVAETNSEGVVLIELEGARRARSFTHQELADLLASGDADFKRNAFAPETAACSQMSPVESVADLDRDDQLLMLWRLAYVMAFLSREKAGEVVRTFRSTTAILPDLEREVDQQEAHRQHITAKAKRAGKKCYKRTAPGATTLLAWVRRWEKSGRDPRSLIPRTHRSGNRRTRFPVLVEKAVSEGIKAYASFQRPTIRDVTKKVRETVRKLNREREAVGLEPYSLPSNRTIARRISRLDPFATYAQRYGAAAAVRKFGAYEDGIKASFPMGRLETDEWKVDVLTVVDQIGALESLSDEVRKTLETTRLWLYVGICCATRCIVGMHLADQPNGADAVRLLSLMTRDKTDLARAAGCESPWHQGGGLGLVSADLGPAFVDETFQVSLLALGGMIASPPGDKPWLRPKIERVFRTFGTQIMPKLAGRTFSNPKERGDYPSEDLAVHTKETLMRILTIHVVDIYHNSPHQGLGGETPADCWERLSAKWGSLPYPGAIQRAAVFGNETERKLTGRGVTVCGINYVCGYLRDLHKRAHGDVVRVRANPEDLGFVLVWNGKGWVQAHAIQPCFEGVSLGQWRLASRELGLRYGQRAELRQDVVERALRKVEEINAEQIEKFNVTIPFLTPEDLAREERQLHLGLTIRPQDQPSIDLPKSPDAIGSEVPLGDRAPDLFNPHPDETPNTTPEEPDNNEDKGRSWGMEDDE